MKKILMAVGAAVLLSVTPAMADGTGVFNSRVALENSGIVQGIQDELMTRFGKRETAWNERSQAFQKKRESAKTDEEKKALEAEAQDILNERNALIRESDRIKVQMDQEVSDMVLEASKKVGKSKKLDLVVDTQGTRVTYLASKYDLMKTMTDELQKLWKKKGSKFKTLDAIPEKK